MRFAAAPLYGVSTSVTFATALAFLCGGLSPVTAGLSLAAGLIICGFAFWRDRNVDPKPRRWGAWDWAAAILFTLFALRAFLWLVFTEGDEVKVLSPNNLGDLSLHFTYIRQLAGGVPFWPENPILAGTKLTYPLGMDLFNTLLILVGGDLVRGLIWVGLLMSAVSLVALWRWGRAFAVAGFLCNGGLAGFVFFRTGELLDYQAELAWKSLPLALFVTQRGLLFALPAGLLLLASWRARFQSSGERRSTLPLWGEWLLYSTMPLFHLHTFLFLSLVLLICFVLQPVSRKPLVRFVGAALVPATIFVFLVTGNLRGPSVIGVHIGWMQSDPDFLALCDAQFGTRSPWVSIPFFWLLNFGVLPFFAALVAVRVWRKPAGDWSRTIFVAAAVTFVLCFFLRFAPWEWDNTKLLLWAYVAVLPLIWQEVILPWPLWLRGLSCFGLFASGFVSLLGGLDNTQRGFAIATRSELDFTEAALRGVALTERFIAHPNYNHPLLLLGRPVLLGYTGHVWSHGYQWKEPLAIVEAILNGEEGWREKARSSGSHLLFWGSQEREAYPDSLQPWRDRYEVVASGDWGEVYDLNREVAGNAAPAPPAEKEP